MIRNPGVAIPVLIMPVALYALFALLIAGEAINKDASLGIYPVRGVLDHGGHHARAVRHSASRWRSNARWGCCA